MDNREIEQQKALKSLIEKGSGIINATMRFGKSKVVIDYLNYLFEKGYLNNDEPILVVVPTTVSKKNWEIEFDKWAETNYNYYITTYRSLNKINTFHKIVIFDEIQNITINSYEPIKNLLKDSKIIGITATIPRKQEKKEILEDMGLEVIYKLPVKKAIDKEIINKFKIKVVYTTLNNRKDIEVKTDKFHFFTSEYKNYKYLTKQVAKNSNKKTLLRRANFIYGSKSKLPATKLILEILNKRSEKTLVFTKRIEIAEKLSVNTIHGKNKDSKIILDRFINNEIRLVASVDMLNEGVTIPDIDNVVIEQLNSNPNNLLQRIGRSLLFKEGKVVKIFIIVLKDTVDEKWLEKALPKDIEIEKYKFENFTFKQIV